MVSFHMLRRLGVYLLRCLLEIVYREPTCLQWFPGVELIHWHNALLVFRVNIKAITD